MAKEIEQYREQYSGQRELKLHLGCGQDYWPGYVNIDVDSSAKADLILDISELENVFDPGSVSEVVMYHVINYLSLWEARGFFQTLSRLLTPEGRLIIETVNLEAALAKVAQSQGNLGEYLEGVRALHAFGRDHMEAQARFVPNRFSWTRWHLEAELGAAGFASIRQTPVQSHAPWRDMRLEASLATPMAAPPGKRLLFLLYYPMGSITMRIRGTIYEAYFKARGWQITYLDLERSDEDSIIRTASEHDLVYCLKVPFLNLYLRLRTETSAKIIFDLTDALWLPHHRNTGWKDLEMILAIADGVFCDNEHVAEYGRKFNPNVRVIHACTQVEQFTAAKASHSRRQDGKIRLGWVGTHGTLSAISKIAPALATICLRHPQVELRLLCLNYQQDQCPDLEGIPHSILTDYDEATMIQEILDMDIGLFPPPFGLDDFAIRGPLKALLYMSGGIPVVAQRGGDCATLIEDGVNGMLADSQEEWEGQLELLLASAERRQAMGEAGHRLVAQRNSLAAVSASLEDELEYIRDHAEHNPALDMFRKPQTASLTPVATAKGSGNGTPKILIGCDFYWPSVGGVETIVKNLGLSLQKLGYEVEIAARALPNRTSDVYEGMLIHSLDADTPTSVGLPRASLQLRELVESGKYVGVILRADPLNWVIWSLEGARVPAHTRTLVQPLINEDGYGNWGGNTGFRQRLGGVLRQTSAVVCLTQTGPDARYLKEEGIPFVHLPNATTPLVPNLDFRQTYDFSPDKPLLVHVANLWPVKNHLGLIEAFRKLDLDCQLALLGNPSGNLEYAEQVKHAVAQDARIKLLHGLSGPQVAAAMQAADLVVLASHGEVFPVSIVEAMSHGKAWIATPQCGAANELSGGVITPLDKFPEAIARLLATPQQLNQLGALGKSHWQQCNQWDSVAKCWQELVATGALRNPPAPPPEVWASTQSIRLAVTEGQAALISVIIPTKNRPHLLAQALLSLQYQTYRRFEVVVANDGGCDVGDVVDYFGSHFPITYIRRSTSGGAAAARNMALSAAQGDIIAYLDDDDYYFTHHLETIATALENTAFDFVYSDAEYVVHKMVDGRPMETTRTRPYQIRPYSRDDLLVANYIPTPTWAHRASLLKQIGGFDESMTILEDWDFLLRASAVARIQKIERLSVEVRQAAFRQDHTLPSAARQLPGFKQLYARYPAPNASVERLRQILLQELETPQGPSQYRVPTAFEDGYPLWVNKHSLEPIHGQVHAERMMAWQRRPHFLLLMPVRQQEMEQLAKTIDGLQQQLYQGWQLIVLSDQPTPNDIFNQSEVLGWLQLDSLEDEQTLVAGCNAVIENIPSDWVALLPPGTTLEPNALLSIGDYAQLHPEWQAIYSDHDFLSATGQRQDPWFKPDFSLDYLRSMDYVGSAVWFQTQALRSAGSFAPFPGALQYDALLRIFDQEGGFSSIGHIAEPLVHLPFSQTEHPLAQASRQVAVEAHLARRKVPGQVEQGLLPDTLRVAYPLERTPLVSIIIPNRDSVWYLRPCLETLFQKTDYTHYEVIIVDNQTEDPDTLAYYDELAATHSERVRIVHYDRPFNFSAQCNLGVEAAQGELILLLNNDTEIIQANWLSRMVAHALRPEVGIVGARLVYPETGKVQHAGVILGLDRLASHGFMNLDMKDPGYLNRLQVEQNYSAVTAACMLVAKELFIQVSGMDEQDTPVLFNDVDFCLKVRELGKLIVWTPYATLVHHESKSLQSELQEIKRRAAIVERDSATALALHVRWKKWLREDPAYNRHLALSTNRSFHVESELVADWDTNFHDRQRILAFPPAGGVGEYRFTAPLKGLTHAARIQSTIVQTRKYHELRYPTLPELNRLEPDVLMQQVDYSPAFLEWQELYRKQRPDMLSVIMIDDLITQMPEDNPNYRRIPRNGRQRLRKLFEQTDRVVVSTQPLFDFVKELTDEVRLVPNSLRDDLWAHLSSQRRVGKKPRVGWAGAQQHKGDLAIISEAVKQTANEVEWVFFGMCPDEIRPYVTEYHQFEVGVEAYPAKLASLNLDLAVAPLQQHPFNEAKSNLRLLEYGVLGLPVVCTDIYPYRTDNAPVTRVANETGAWVQAIRERVHDLDATAKEGDALQQWVRQRYLLSHHLDAWFKALTDPRP